MNKLTERDLMLIAREWNINYDQAKFEVWKLLEAQQPSGRNRKSITGYEGD